jgi:hypothetical protein
MAGVQGIGSELHATNDFDISGAEPSASATRALVN